MSVSINTNGHVEIGGITPECFECGKPFTEAEWDDRHDFEGYDCHAHCCPVCKENNEAVRLVLVLSFEPYEEGEPHPMESFSKGLDALIDLHFPNTAHLAYYGWEHI